MPEDFQLWIPAQVVWDIPIFYSDTVQSLHPQNNGLCFTTAAAAEHFHTHIGIKGMVMGML